MLGATSVTMRNVVRVFPQSFKTGARFTQLPEFSFLLQFATAPIYTKPLCVSATSAPPTAAHCVTLNH